MRGRWAVWVVGALVGCGGVQVVKRDDCWVRQTKSFPNQTNEEVGICGRPAPEWSQDRVTRLVQECMADADYRWRNEALIAWNRGQPLPPEKPEHEMMQACMNDAATSLVQENQLLQSRVSELSRERDGLRAQTEADHQGLRESQAQMTQALGEAAKRPAPNAFALATSSGAANSKPDAQAPAPVVMPTVVPVQIYGAPGKDAPQVATRAEQPKRPAPAKAAQAKPTKAEPAPSCATPAKAPAAIALQPNAPVTPVVAPVTPSAAK